ncbi:hypothetical protein LINPERHAP2_LOCUS26041 [Linum perenne]
MESKSKPQLVTTGRSQLEILPCIGPLQGTQKPYI